MLSGGESNDAEDPVRKSLNTDLSLTISAGGPDVTASVTTPQFIPGKSENPTEGGHPLDSGLMQLFPANDSFDVWGYNVELATEPVLDNWLSGDMTEELPARLEDAQTKKAFKYRDDVGPDPFKEYRFENGLTVSFETTSDLRINKDTVKIEFNEVGPAGSDSIIARGEQDNSKTVLHDHELNGIPWKDWYDGENVRRSNRHRRYYSYDTEFEFDGAEGIRVLTF